MNRIIKIVALVFLPAGLYGQMAPLTSQYMLNPVTINPSLAGHSGALNISLFYKSQWTGIEGSPETTTLAIDAPFPYSKLGLGLIIASDRIGVTKRNRFTTSYAYKIDMGEGRLSFGLGAGMVTINSAWSDLTADDPGDDAYLINSPVFIVPSFSFGVYYSRLNFFAGISVPELTGNRFNFNTNRYDLVFEPEKYHYLLYTGYIFSLSPKLVFSPSTLVAYSAGEDLLYDINAHFNMADRLWLGVSYRNNRSVGGLIQIAVNKQFKVAYLYDFDLGRLGRYSNGSHEVMLRYEFHYQVKAVNQLIF